MIHEIIDHEMEIYANEKVYPEEWNLKGLIDDAVKFMHLKIH